MDLKRVVVAVAAASAMTCSRLTPEKQIIADVAKAMGGSDRVLAVKTIVLEGTGYNANLGQDLTPEATSQRFDLTGYRRAIDLAGKRVRIEQTRTPNFPYFQGQAPQKQVFGADGDVGYNIAPDGSATRVANAVAKDRRADIYHHPVALVRAALDSNANVMSPHTLGKERAVEVTLADGSAFTLAMDLTTMLPTRIVSMTDNPNLGDVAIETSFADYQDVNGLKLPMRFTTTTDKFTTAEIRVTKQTTDGETGDLAAPASAASAAPVTGPPPAVVTVTDLADGVWLLGGQSHHSVVIEFNDHLMLVEAPQNEVRTIAVIEKAKTLRPAKPLTGAVNTHHHFDHSGGVRAALSAGLTLFTHKANTEFYQEAVGRSHTIAPDVLSRNAKPLMMEPVDEQMVLSDDTMTVELYAIDANPHASTLLMVYLPKQRLLIEADVFTPGAAVQPYAANLIENIKRRNLKVDRIVPLHGAVVPFAELLKTQPTTGH